MSDLLGKGPVLERQGEVLAGTGVALQFTPHMTKLTLKIRNQLMQIRRYSCDGASHRCFRGHFMRASAVVEFTLHSSEVYLLPEARHATLQVRGHGGVCR